MSVLPVNDISSTALRSLILALGSPEFPRKLLQTMQSLLDVHHLAIIVFDEQLTARITAAESVGQSVVAKAAGKIYERSLFYRVDPNMRAIRAESESDEPLLMRLRAREIGDEEYRSKIFEQFQLIDRASILDHGSGHWHAINFYRESDSGEFSPADLLALQAVAGTVAALVAKHFAILPAAASQGTRPSVEVFEALVGRLDARLTTRQVQVCARALMGMTNVAVGLSLGIQVPTVATLRKRAYATLQISSLNELFALCLAQTSVASSVATSDP